jgi:hypothetical protein
MENEERSKFQDTWLVAGGASLAVLGTCALISLCAALALIWFSKSRSSNDVRATPTNVVQQATAVSPTQQTPLTISTQPVAAIPTPLPIPNTSGRVPTTFPLPSQATAPDQAVRTYYNLVSQQRYDQTWPMLTDTFKQKFNCCAPNYNYTGYVDWWNSVDRVEFGNVHTVSQNGDQALVYAELYYVMNDGGRSSMVNTPYIALNYDSVAGYWQFNDMRATP